MNKILFPVPFVTMREGQQAVRIRSGANSLREHKADTLHSRVRHKKCKERLVSKVLDRSKPSLRVH